MVRVESTLEVDYVYIEDARGFLTQCRPTCAGVFPVGLDSEQHPILKVMGRINLLLLLLLLL